MSNKSTVESLVQSMKDELLQSVRDGVVPANVPDFAALHDHIDANVLGCNDDLFNRIVTESSTDQEHDIKLAMVHDIANPAMLAVDSWIKSGALRTKFVVGQLVKLTNCWCLPNEMDARYTVVSVMPSYGSHDPSETRYNVELVCDMNIKPVECLKEKMLVAV